MIPKLYKVISGKYVDDTLNYLLSHQGGGASVNTFTQDIVLTGNTIPLETGFYNTGNYGLFVGSQTPQNIIFGAGEIIYVDTSTLTIVGSLVSISYDLLESVWTIQDNQKIENELTNNRDKIPTSQAVYSALGDKQDSLTAGQGISIVNNVISATGGGGGEESYAVNGSNPNVFTLSTTSNYEKIPMEIIDQIGNLFSTNSQGYVVANQDIDMALITFKAPLESANNTSVRYIRIAINDNVKAISFSTMNSNTKLNITIPNLLVTDIKQGDIITFEFYGYSGDKISNHNGQFTITSVLPSNPARDLNVHNYSTSEQVVGTWTNGKPLYEKVITGTTPNVTTDGTSASLALDIIPDTTKVDFAFIVSAFVDQGTTGSTWTMPYYSDSMRYIKSSIYYNPNTSSRTKRLQITSNGTAYNNCTYYCVVRYTKASD